METRPLFDLIAALRKGDGNGCRHANALMQEAADALMANQGAIVNSIIERTRTETPRMIDTYDDHVSEVSFDQGWAVKVHRHGYGCTLEWERRGSLDQHLTDILPSEALVFAAAIAGELGNTSGEVPEPSTEPPLRSAWHATPAVTSRGAEPQGEPTDARKVSEAISRASVRGVEFMDQGEGPGDAISLSDIFLSGFASAIDAVREELRAAWGVR